LEALTWTEPELVRQAAAEEEGASRRSSILRFSSYFRVIIWAHPVPSLHRPITTHGKCGAIFLYYFNCYLEGFI
jgi:hypothetical protein